MEEFEFRIVNIKVVNSDEIEITINIWDKGEITIILENLTEEGEEKVIKSKNHTFTISPISYTMQPCKESELEECFSIYHKMEYSDNLNPRLRRQWLTANIVDKLTALFFKEGYFKNKIFTNLTVDDIEDE